ncbi:Zinc carboxypeptidase [Colwellia chukchiensis]|uniref:Zinc carboxypeptidase n=1 Tax=Colwellia chukchiensis TaxID=641665 RepID=A0A1H7Q0G2_9GAMM|nr:M14 family zinc carboxypeptidase [Colwellia chukchiensis]SEL41299.1 Zinc carboxypeptidase [Colwellia chukchiensis]
MLLSLVRLALLLLVSISFTAASANVSTYLPDGAAYSESIPKPEASLGYGIGERHPRYDQVLAYLRELATASPRIKMTEMGRTVEFRAQVLLTISSPENLNNLEQILARRGDLDASANDPVVVWLGYSVHGDEISGTNAAMVVAYHLAAAEDAKVKQMLADTIIVIEPSVNPDGMDRFVNWVDTHRGVTANPDPNHIEHHQPWRTGRTNHFGFDLNRDWLLLSQQESQNRLAFFHQYQPNVLGDFHEMGANSSYFFQPGIPTRTHPLTPAKNTELTHLLASYHAKALDAKQRLYYSEESFDDFYYGKGSTYPDINGGVGVLFEQASSRGFQQQTVNGLLTFEYGIQNQVLTSLSTIEGTWQNQTKFKTYRQRFYQQALQQASDENFKGYIVSESLDHYRMQAFLHKLSQHQIKVYPLTQDYKLHDKVFPAQQSYYIPLAQRQYRLIKALFNQQKSFADNTFYDVSGWTLPLAMNIKFAQVGRTWGLKTAKQAWQAQAKSNAAVDNNAYAYVFHWHDFLAPKLLYKLTKAKIAAKVATKVFSAEINGQIETFNPGSIVVAAGTQTLENWREVLSQLALDSQIPLHALTTGLTPTGIDIGSRSSQTISLPKVLLVGGKGVSQYEAGEMLYYLDNLLEIPVSVVEMPRLAGIDLAAYSHVIMVDGNYSSLSKKAFAQLKTWLQNGGVLFSQKRAARWLSEQELLNVDFVNKAHIDQLFDTENLNYGDKEQLAGRKRIAGAIFQANLDHTHPLTYGFAQQPLPVFRNSTVIMEQTNVPFITVASYAKAPLLSGYSDQNLVNRLAHNPTLVAHNVGKGRVIASTDNLAFRGYFLGSMKVIANSLFFAKAFSAAGR